jgi:phosphoglycolate phosphatase-like HAD superfamily hydrolase
MSNNPEQILKDLVPQKEYFIGFDSDGCVFDTMEIKHKECFCPNFIKYMGFQGISKYAREAWEFVNLYSKSRGCNRFLALLKSVELLNKRTEVIARNPSIPAMVALEEWIGKESRLGNLALKRYAQNTNESLIHTLLLWSEKVNEEIADMVKGIPPYPYVKKSLEMLKDKADMIVVSQTPVEALTREWRENNIEKYVRVIAGQELGTKTEHLEYAAKGKFENKKILMVGDAPGDMKAAQSNNVLFYPINPGHEEASWERFYNEAIDRFFSGNYSGEFEDMLINEFESFLPENPPW